jgi:hypothetical protein
LFVEQSTRRVTQMDQVSKAKKIII